MDAMIGNMRSTFGNGVRKMFSTTTMGTRNNTNQSDKASNDQQVTKMLSLCSICELEGSTVPFLVRDICKFMTKKCIKLEGIFRVCASVRQVTELRAIYESNANFNDDLLLSREDSTEVTGHTAAGLLKQFFRHLSEPLIHDDVLRIFIECKTLSDNEFCDKVSVCMDNWPTCHRRTLLFLLTFLHTVAQESENRMSVNGLGVVFGPNVFKLPDGIEGLQAQTIANQAFERLLSCSYILCRTEQTTPPTKQQPPPRPALPIRRPLPPTPGEVTPPTMSPRRPEQTSGDSPAEKHHLPTSDVTKPVPAVRKSIGTRVGATASRDVTAVVMEGDAMIMKALTKGDELSDDIKAILVDAKVTDARDTVASRNPVPQKKAIVTGAMAQNKTTEKTGVFKDEKPRPQIMPRGDTAPQDVSPRDARNSQSDSEEIPENIIEHSDSVDEWQTGSGNSTGEYKAVSEANNLLDNSIRAIVRTRLFNSIGSASSDDADSASHRIGLLPSTTAGRDRGPKNRRRPSRRKQLLSHVQLDNSDDDDDDDDVTKPMGQQPPKHLRNGRVTIMAEKDYGITNPRGQFPPTSSKSVPLSSGVSSFTTSIPSACSTSVTTVTTPDSGCIVDDYPRNSSPITSELARLDIGRGLSPVHIPKLNLRNSQDEEDMLKLCGATPPPCVDLVPQLDLSSVTESVDRETIKPVRQVIVQDEQAIGTPPRPAPKHATKKKRKKISGQKKTVKISEVTPQVSDSEILEEDCDETMEQTRDRITQNLRDNRRIAGRPYDITKMASDELKEEKLSMQRELLKFEARHGRPTMKESKQLMRELYDRYRAVKRLLAVNEKREFDENENAIQQELNESFLVTKPYQNENQSCDESVVTQEGILDTPTSDLLNSLREFRSRRKRLRRILRDFENERNTEGSNLERRIMRSEYEEYRSIKSKVRELEIALAKKGVEIF